MAGFSNYAENELLDHALSVASFTMPAGCFIQLHTADPTDTGTTAVAGNATRKSASFAAASGGTSTSDADIEWTTGEVDTTEVYSHFSLWDASTAGNCIGTGTVTGGSVTAGNAFTIASGNLTFSLD